MFDIRKPKQKTGIPIRAASNIELVNFEKQKSRNILMKTDVISVLTKPQAPTPPIIPADDTKIESIRINGDKLKVEPYSNEVRIDLGNLAFKSSISPTELSTDDYFFINCELDENTLK